MSSTGLMRVYPVVRLNHLSELRFSFQPSARRLMRISVRCFFSISQNLEIFAKSLAGTGMWIDTFSVYLIDGFMLLDSSPSCKLCKTCAKNHANWPNIKL